MIYVVGRDHDAQSGDRIPFLLDSARVIGERDQFLRLVERILIDQKVEFVAEEWGRKSESFAEALTKKLTVRYLNINTTFEDLNALQIPSDYMESPCYTEQERRVWLQRRERFMLEKIHSARGTAKTLLVICGFCHLKPLAEMLGDGERVIPVDYREEA
jgi:hypothetical protein